MSEDPVEYKVKKKRTRKTPKYRLFQAHPETENAMVLVKEAPVSTRKSDIMKWLQKNAESVLQTNGLEKMKVYIFAEPADVPISREVVVKVG